MLQLGVTLYNEHIFLESREVLQECYNGRIAKSGKLNPETLTALDALAVTLIETEPSLDKAEALFKDCIKAREKVLGKAKVDTFKAIFHLGCLYDKFNVNDKALEMLGKAVRGQKTLLGWRLHTDHTDLLRDNAWADAAVGEQHSGACIEAMVRLADVLVKTGDRLAAQNLYVEVDQHLLGLDHVVTLRSLHLLATLYHQKREFVAAEALFENCISRRRLKIGIHHQDSLR